MAGILDLNALFNFMCVCLRLCYCCLAFKMGIIVFTKKLLIPKTEILFTYFLLLMFTACRWDLSWTCTHADRESVTPQSSVSTGPSTTGTDCHWNICTSCRSGNQWGSYSMFLFRGTRHFWLKQCVKGINTTHFIYKLHKKAIIFLPHCTLKVQFIKKNVSVLIVIVRLRSTFKWDMPAKKNLAYIAWRWPVRLKLIYIPNSDTQGYMVYHYAEICSL